MSVAWCDLRVRLNTACRLAAFACDPTWMRSCNAFPPAHRCSKLPSISYRPIAVGPTRVTLMFKDGETDSYAKSLTRMHSYRGTGVGEDFCWRMLWITPTNDFQIAARALKSRLALASSGDLQPARPYSSAIDKHVGLRIKKARMRHPGTEGDNDEMQGRVIRRNAQRAVG